MGGYLPEVGVGGSGPLLCRLARNSWNFLRPISRSSALLSSCKATFRKDAAILEAWDSYFNSVRLTTEADGLTDD